MSDLEDRWRDLGEFIREQRSLGELSLRRLSELAGVSNPYLSQIERGLRKPSAEILRQIAQALHISAETLYVRAGILENNPVPVDLIAEIRRDTLLDEAQKRALIHIYQSFRAERAARLAPVALADDEVELVALAEEGVADLDALDALLPPVASPLPRPLGSPAPVLPPDAPEPAAPVDV
jgi:transcriptional regulator with XRE-family HTH domain